MKENFDSALQHVLVHEGGYSDHPDHPGGATMKGVTLAVYRRFFGADKTKNDLRNITDAELAQIYRTGYGDKCKCDDLPAGVDYALFDSAVNSGPGNGARWLQGAVSVFQDGAIGPDTIAKVGTVTPKAIINNMFDRRLAFLKVLPTWTVFGRRWNSRVDQVRATALEMAGQDVAAKASSPDVSFDIVRRGSKGAWVVMLQQALDITVDGDFGPKTEAAL
jgi:lysozyme family protein